jgi:hypothetical protein
MHLGEAQPTLFQEQMAGMLAVMQVIGVVHNTFDVALIVAHLHLRLKNVLFLHNGCKVTKKSEECSVNREEFYCNK